MPLRHGKLKVIHICELPGTDKISCLYSYTKVRNTNGYVFRFRTWLESKIFTLLLLLAGILPISKRFQVSFHIIWEGLVCIMIDQTWFAIQISERLNIGNAKWKTQKWSQLYIIALLLFSTCSYFNARSIEVHWLQCSINVCSLDYTS